MRPQIKSNAQERYIISPTVKKYIQNVISLYPEMWEQLKVLRTKLANDLSCLC